jgi:hypothetical protein
VRSPKPTSSSADESDANDEDAAEGGSMRGRMLLCRHRGVGIETCGASQHAYHWRKGVESRHTTYGDRGGRDAYGTNMSMAAKSCTVLRSTMGERRRLPEAGE